MFGTATWPVTRRMFDVSFDWVSPFRVASTTNTGSPASMLGLVTGSMTQAAGSLAGHPRDDSYRPPLDLRRSSDSAANVDTLRHCYRFTAHP
jgi:hypothetical protein